MNRRSARKTIRSHTPTPSQKPSPSVKHHKTVKQPPHPGQSDDSQTKPLASGKHSDSKCPSCGGWIIAEPVMDLYSQQSLKKCLNCGRILVNPFLPQRQGTPSRLQRSPRQEPPPVKLDSTYWVHFH